MIIVFVEDNFGHLTNGTSTSAYRFRNELIRRGHTVRILARDVQGEDMYSLAEHRVPLASAIARKNNMYFAQYDEQTVRRAFKGADIVHLFFPWQLEQKCLRLARQMGIPVCGAFHCQPENITYNISLQFFEPVNTFIYFLFKTWLYRKLDNIHCPSLFTARELGKHKYHSRLHIISNGVSDVFKPPSVPLAKTDDKIHILMIGRLAKEKRQDLLIKAVNSSKYRETIQLHFVGRGPLYKHCLKLGAMLPNPPQFEIEFMSQEALLDLIHKADMYVHTSEVELESIACLEAVSCGKTPVISDSKKSAASQFALDERSLFKKGNSRDLRKKIEYWIDHGAERKSMEERYAELGKRYNIDHSIDKIEKMFEDAIKGNRAEKMIREDVKLRQYYRNVARRNRIKEFFCALFYFCIAIPLLQILDRVYFGLKIKNGEVLKKLKKTGAVTVCNHVHEMDSTACAVAMPLRKLIYVSLPSNFKLGVASIFVNILGSVPTPSGPKEIQLFIHALSKQLRQRRIVHFYPEGELRRYDPEIRDFHRGAFYLAVDARVPVLPIRIVFREPRGFFRIFKKKSFTLVFGEPVYPDPLLIRKAAAGDIQNRVREMMIRCKDHTCFFYDLIKS
jgi:glycosyltransferase involved in cell wall biosynthesis/1-acyl-sn-glycerol-3-phosphate acyltransferase